MAQPSLERRAGHEPGRSLSALERFLRVFSDIRPGEGPTGLLLLANIFLVLASYYLIKPVREGWLSISAVQGLSKIELKAYSGFGQSLVLLGLVPLYGWLASRVPRRVLITAVTLFFMGNMVLFWLAQPGLLPFRLPYAGVAFYLWVGIFSVTVVAQFWSFAADLYSDERGKRVFPLIAVGASAGAAAGSWFAGSFIKTAGRETFDLILVALLPLAAALALTWAAERHGTARGTASSRADRRREMPAAPEAVGAYRLIFRHRYLLAVAVLSLLINWVNTNGENILYHTVQEAVEARARDEGVTEPAALERFVKTGTTAFYSDLYLWVNLAGLLLQAFVVSRLLKYGGVAAILMATPLVSLLSYSLMALFPVLMLIRVMKIAENAANYSVNNTARHVLWLPTPPTMIYKAKTAVDTLFMRAGDALAAVTVMVGVQLLDAPGREFLVFNVFLALLWCGVGWFVVRENRRILARPPAGASAA